MRIGDKVRYKDYRNRIGLRLWAMGKTYVFHEKSFAVVKGNVPKKINGRPCLSVIWENDPDLFSTAPTKEFERL